MSRPKREVVRHEGLTPEMIGVANKRTMPLLASLNMLDFDLRQLAASCYLQGIRDFADTMASRPELFKRMDEPAEPLDFQI